jgi:Phage tail-collar fibre protein
MPTTILTDVAVQKIRTAAGDASAVAITHIALGDGLGAPYAPLHSAVGLRRELVRKPIEQRSALGNDAWRVRVAFGPETLPFMVREMGFFDGAGSLIALWAGLDIDPRQTGAITYLVDHILSFSRVEAGLLIVEAPDDELFDFAVVTLGHQARQDLLLKQFRDRLA